MILVVVATVYLSVLVAIGIVCSRRGAASAEDYFLAGRSLGSLVLFMALFGTNVTAFALLGLPGLAYHKGVGVFGFFGASAAFWGVLVFILLGYPIWKIGKERGYMTPSQMFRDRWQSPWVGRLLLGLLLLYTVPYLVIGIMGGGIAIHTLSDGRVSFGAAAGVVTAVTVFYTSVGGMRGTAWTNVFQAGVFIVFLIVACIGIGERMGGAEHLFDRLANERPDLLRHQFGDGYWATAFLVGPVSIIAFPHMFMRLLAARDARSLRRTIHFYPWALMLLFVPVTLIGVWGALAHPGLVGKASDQILPMLLRDNLNPWLSAAGLAAILAAVMSSLDGQMLTISTMVSVDVFRRADETSGRRWGRISVIVVAATALVVALGRYEAIFSISVYAFSGYTLIVPVMAAAFFWRRSTAAGIIAGSVAGHLMLLLYSAPASVTNWTGLRLPAADVYPVAICLAVEIPIIVVVSLLTRPPRESSARLFDDPFGEPRRSIP